MAKSSPVRILLVEDSPSDESLIQAHLEESKWKVKLACHPTREAAIGYLKQQRVDVVLLDLSLPDSQGIDTFREIQAAAKQSPVVILTGRDDAKLAQQALSEGAQDYLLKNRLTADSLARSIRYSIERTRRQRAESELKAAGLIHRRLLPKMAPTLPNWDACGRCDPATFVGGDYFDFFSLGEDLLGVVIADAAGHGLASSITMSETRAVIRAFSTLSSDVAEILTRARAVLQWDLSKETFVAVFLARINMKARTLQYVSAGHMGFILGDDGRNKQTLQSEDPPLGVDPRARYTASPEIRLQQGDSLFLFTDGFTDAANPQGERFGRRQVFETIRERVSQGAEAMLDYLFDQVDTYREGTPRVDDMTAALVKAAAPAEKKTVPAPRSEADEGVGGTAAASPAVATTAVAHEEYDHFEADQQGEIAVLHIREKEILSSQKCGEVRSEIVEYVRNKACSRVVLSFQVVEKLSSEAINMCLHIKSELAGKGGELRLCDLKPHVREAFRALNLDGSVFSIHDNVAGALSSF